MGRMFERSKHPRTIQTIKDADGKVIYRLSKKVSAQRAFTLGMQAKADNLPIGSVIEVNDP